MYIGKNRVSAAAEALSGLKAPETFVFHQDILITLTQRTPMFFLKQESETFRFLYDTLDLFDN